MRKLQYGLLFSTVAGICSGQAQAEYLKLYHPKVEKGELSAEADLNYDFDHRNEKDGYFSQVVGFEYGLTNWWQTELSLEIEKAPGDHDRLTNYKWENVFAPWTPGKYWMDVGLYAELEKGRHSDDPYNFETKLLLEKDVGKYANTANLTAAHQFGPHRASSWDTALALQTRYRYDQKFEPGIEYYAEFGAFDDNLSFSEQTHRLGPVVLGKLGRVKYDTGLLFGVSREAPDATVKLNLEYEF